MQTSFVTTHDFGVLHAVRSVLEHSDDALFCVAFMSEGGLNLISKEIVARSKRGAKLRVLVTTVFGSTTVEGLKRAGELDVELGVFNKSGGTYHPKVYLGRGHQKAHAFIGSANLTSGLAGNIEAGMHFDGRREDAVIADAWDWAEGLWSRATKPAETEYPVRRPAPAEVIDPLLYAALARQLAKNPVVTTLGSHKRNVVIAHDPQTLWVATDATAANGSGAQPVPAWMINAAWNALTREGSLSNTTLLNELRVMRSSFVCALLARVPGVEAQRSPIRLVWRG